MRRVLLAIVLCLVLGFLASLSIAWAAAVSYAPMTSSFETRGRDWSITCNERFAITEVMAGRLTHAATTTEDLRDLRFDTFRAAVERMPEAHSILTLAAGWPSACFTCDAGCEQPIILLPWWYEYSGAVVGTNLLADAPDGIHVALLPIRPHWPGLVENSIVYALLFAALVAIVALCRRILHRIIMTKRKCAYCSYDVRSASEHCPECGAALDVAPRITRSIMIVPLLICVVALFALAISIPFVTAAGEPYSAVHYAAFAGDTTRLSELLDAGVAVDKPLEMERGDGVTIVTPLLAAVDGGQVDSTKLLIQRGANVNANSIMPGLMSPLLNACGRGDEDIAMLLIESGALVNVYNSQGETPLIIALQKFDRQLAIAMVNAGADVNYHPGHALSPLVYAAKRGDFDLIEILIANGATGDEIDLLLNFAMRNDDEALVRRVLASEQPFEWHLLATYTARGDLESLEKFISYGADPLVLSKKNETLFFSAANSEDQLQVWEELIRLGIDVNAQSRSGWTALIASIWKQQHSLMNFLLDHGADIQLKDNRGQSALDHAVMAENEIAVRTLLSRGASAHDVHAQVMRRGPKRLVQIIEDAQQRDSEASLIEEGSSD